MEALESRLTTGEQSGGQEYSPQGSLEQDSQPKSPSQPHQQQQQTESLKPHVAPQPPKLSKRQNPERKRLRHQRQSIDSDSPPENKHETSSKTKVLADSSLLPGVLPTTLGSSTQSKKETQELNSKQKRERKPQRPGKYVCSYCGRACAKPSVLQKHIRSHTGERPYPCAPCGFSFKTKSNLYKHRKSHTHRVKAGLALGEKQSLEEQVPESEDESRPPQPNSSLSEPQSSVVSVKDNEADGDKDSNVDNRESFAVKKRLALRLSRGKHPPQESDEKSSSLILGSRGSTESGYFSRSESTEQSQDSPPNTSAKTYAEIILGKYGRLGQLHRMSRHQNQQSSGEEEKSVAFTVPKKQVIDHITKLITINEAVVDTSKIDSVKPRRFSLSRKNSSESQKSVNLKELHLQSPKLENVGYKNSGSITMGVPCERFHHPSLNLQQPSAQASTAPLLRSQSMPSAAGSFDSGSPGKFRISQSFDEQQPSQTRTQTPRRYGMLKRQPAIEIPLGREDDWGPQSFHLESVTTKLDQKQINPQPYVCEACGISCMDWEGYRTHKQRVCGHHHPRNEEVNSQMECSQTITQAARAGALTLRKRRKEESFEFDDPSSPSLISTNLSSEQCKDKSTLTFEVNTRHVLQTCSVIQHTSSFEKQESFCNENQKVTKGSPSHVDSQIEPQKQLQQPLAKPIPKKLVRQHNVQVPEIFVTEDSNMSRDNPTDPTITDKYAEKPEEFQWPQRSSSLAQLPIEKLPPKKKRLRLAEAAQSSGESSFDSISLPHSPSQDSSASYASSRSASFEEPNRLDNDTSSSTPLRRSRAPHMLTVPGVHQHREMRRSASEQSPHDPQPNTLMAETRSKSFDYSCLSPERSAAGWKERRKCLLMKHTPVRDPDEEVEDPDTISTKSLVPSRSSQITPLCCTKSSSLMSCEDVESNPVEFQNKEIFSQDKLGQSSQLSVMSHDPTIVVKEDSIEQSCTKVLPPRPTIGPSGAARAHYLPMSTGLKLKIPFQQTDYSEVQKGDAKIQDTVSLITTSQEILVPFTSPAVVVRLQANTLTPACAIYTTLSQCSSPGPLEAFDAVSNSIGITTTDYENLKDTHTDLQPLPDGGLRLFGTGGNKRMLSPSNSIELPPESKQQQKRVKEEEDRDVGCADRAAAVTRNQELSQETQLCLPAVCSTVSHVGLSFPSLLSSTCNSWCYLNYIKPNPSAVDDQKPSVYSSWSTSGYNPNPPGLSSKTALSLLHCKQRLSPSIYTVSPMAVSESMDQEENNTSCSTEVENSRSGCRNQEKNWKGLLMAHENSSSQKNKGDEKKERNYEKKCVSSPIRNNQPPKDWILVQGSRPNEEYSLVRDGGDEKNQLEITSVGSTDSPPCGCWSALKAAGSTPAEHQEELRKDISHQPDNTHDGGLDRQSVHHHHQQDIQSLHVEAGADDDDNLKIKSAGDDEDSRITVAQGSQMESEKGHLGNPRVEHVHKPLRDSTPRMSASARRNMFARRHFGASTLSPSRGSCSPSAESMAPRSQTSPTASPSPSHSPAPTSSISTSGCHVSSEPQRPASPVMVQSLELGSSGPLGSLADVSAECQTCFHLRDQPTTARPPLEDIHVPSNASRPRGSHNVLSHLPLHSQQPSRAPSLLIPIGGIHMIQPRSTLPLYNLRSSSTAAPQPHQRPPLTMTSPSSPAHPQARPHTPSPDCFGNQKPSSPTKWPTEPELSTVAPDSQSNQGQKEAPPTQTQL